MMALPYLSMIIIGLVLFTITLFGSHGMNLALTCTGQEAHVDPIERDIAGVACRISHIAIGTFAHHGYGVRRLTEAINRSAGRARSFERALRRIGKCYGRSEPAKIAFLITNLGISLLGLCAAFRALALLFRLHLDHSYNSKLALS